jgi:hypothetical protein
VNFFDGLVEGEFIGGGGFSETAEFSHKLQGRGPNLSLGGGRFKIEKGFDITAHGFLPPKSVRNVRKSPIFSPLRNF